MDVDGSEIDQENNNSSTKRSPLERKLSYRQLLDKVEGICESDDVGLQSAKEIGHILKSVNSLEEECNIDERVEHADETLLDSMVLSSVSSILVKCIEAVDVFTSTYEPNDFANKIIKHIQGDDAADFQPENLQNLMDIANKLIPKVPVYKCVYGTYDLNKVPEPKQKKIRQKRQRELLQKKEPEKITNLNKEEDGIEEIVKTLHDVLKEEYQKNDQEPVKYYEYVIDTDSFANTVENIFYCSFLIRDGRAHIDIDSRGVPLIKPMKKKELKAFRDEGGKNSQMIASISVDEWEKFKTEGFIQKHKRKNHRMKNNV